MNRSELGKIIKEARLSKKMTQSEVVGTFITRNMLSQIESGVAIPSIKTLEYLSKKLDISIQMLSPNAKKDPMTVELVYSALADAKAHYREASYLDAAELASNYLAEDCCCYDEACAIYTRSCLALARSAFFDAEKRLFYAKEARRVSEMGFYSCKEWKDEADRFIKELQLYT